MNMVVAVSLFAFCTLSAHLFPSASLRLSRRSYWQSWAPGEGRHLLYRERQATVAQVRRAGRSACLYRGADWSSNGKVQAQPGVHVHVVLKKGAEMSLSSIQRKNVVYWSDHGNGNRCCWTVWLNAKNQGSQVSRDTCISTSSHAHTPHMVFLTLKKKYNINFSGAILIFCFPIKYQFFSRKYRFIIFF